MSVNQKSIDKSAAGIAPVVLFVAIAITLLIIIYPRILSDINNKADQLAAMFLCFSMSAGYVRGVGFIPKNYLLRCLFSSYTCIFMLILAILRIKNIL